MDDVLKEIALKIAAGKAVVFCGAGISKESGLPLATELQEEILHWTVRLDDETKRTIEQQHNSDLSFEIQLQLQKNELCRSLLSSHLPFEFFFQVLSEVGDIRNLIQIFSAGEPNINHVTLARLVKEGYLRTICTTNFDPLLEQALLNEGLVQNVDFDVSAEADEIELIDWSSDRTHVVKLHGTCEDFESIGVTLKNVSQRTLSSSRRVAVDQIFSKGPHEMVLLLGYSCSDYFDIIPQIRASHKTDKQIVLVNHSPLADRVIRTTTGTPFEHFSNSMILECDTRRVIESLWANVLRSDIPRPTVGQPAWRFRVMDWYEASLTQLGEAFCLSFVGLLLLYNSRFLESLPYLLQVTFAGEKTIRPGYLANMAICLEALGHYSKAIQFLEWAIEISAKVNNREFEGRTLANLGLVHTRMTNYKQALDCHLRGLDIARELKDATSKCEHLCNSMLPLCQMGEYDKALAYGQEALQIARDSGYKHAEGRVLNEIGNLYHSMHANEEALENYMIAREIAIQVGDREAEGNALGNIANVYGRLGNYHESIRHNKDALAIARQIKDRLGEVTRLFNIANSHMRLGEFEQAREHYENALSSGKEFLDEKHPLIVQSHLMILQFTANPQLSGNSVS
jgi:tetratricopeptide (TPR) repeat protein